MLKVKNMMHLANFVMYRNFQLLCSYGDIEVVDSKPDIYLFHMHINAVTAYDVGSYFIMSTELDLTQIAQLAETFLDLSKKPLLFWQTGYAEEWREGYMKESDIVFGHGVFPDHPNSLGIRIFCDENNFYPDSSIKREPRTAAVMYDQDYLRLICELMDKVVILGVDNLSEVSQYKDLVRFRDKIVVRSIPASDTEEIRRTLNGVEYVVSTHNIYGEERLGIEGLLCGAQPLYPGSLFYKERYGDLDGLRFFDPESPFETIKSALDAPSSIGEAEVQQAVDKFSAQKHVPLFWEQVKEILNKQGADHHVHIQPDNATE